jgi:hypothetical protein
VSFPLITRNSPTLFVIDADWGCLWIQQFPSLNQLLVQYAKRHPFQGQVDDGFVLNLFAGGLCVDFLVRRGMKHIGGQGVGTQQRIDRAGPAGGLRPRCGQG